MNKACHLCIPLGPPQMALSLADPGNPGRCPLTAMVAIARMCRRAGCVLLARLQQAFERRCFIQESQTLQGQLKHGLSRRCPGSSSRGGVSTCIRRHRRRQIQRAPESVSPKPVLRSRAARLPSHAMCKLGVLLFRAKQGALAGRVPFGRVLSTLSALPCLFPICLPPVGI
jgi:hypothetical protein